jgi:hypothetical protein
MESPSASIGNPVLASDEVNGYPAGLRNFETCTRSGCVIVYFYQSYAGTLSMARFRKLSPRDRQEAGLLLKVILAHLNFRNANDEQARQLAHDHLVSEARILFEFVTMQNATKSV